MQTLDIVDFDDNDEDVTEEKEKKSSKVTNVIKIDKFDEEMSKVAQLCRICYPDCNLKSWSRERGLKNIPSVNPYAVTFDGLKEALLPKRTCKYCQSTLHISNTRTEPKPQTRHYCTTCKQAILFLQDREHTNSKFKLT